MATAWTWSGSGRGCNELTGQFVVREIELAPGGSVLRFAADFEQHCEDMNPGLFGAIRYNSTISDLTPFEGNYPVYELTVTPPDHGRLTATGIDCGGGAMSCVLPLSTPTVVRLTATPDPGYAFERWSGDCSGAITTWVAVNQRKRCSAVFVPGIQGTTALFLDSQPGDYVGQGLQRTLTTLDGTFGFQRNYRNGVDFWFTQAGQPILAGVSRSPRRECPARRGIVRLGGELLDAVEWARRIRPRTRLWRSHRTVRRSRSGLCRRRRRRALRRGFRAALQ